MTNLNYSENIGTDGNGVGIFIFKGTSENGKNLEIEYRREVTDSLELIQSVTYKCDDEVIHTYNVKFNESRPYKILKNAAMWDLENNVEFEDEDLWNDLHFTYHLISKNACKKLKSIFTNRD